MVADNPKHQLLIKIEPNKDNGWYPKPITIVGKDAEQVKARINDLLNDGWKVNSAIHNVLYKMGFF